MILFIILLFFQFLRKLNRQERVIEEVKLVLKPHYNKKHITKDEYKDIMRRAVPKVKIKHEKILLIESNRNINKKFNFLIDLP